MAKKAKQAKSKVPESAELAQAVVRCPGLGIYVVQDGKFQYANALFYEMTGYTEQELRSIHPLDLVHPEDRELVRERAIENLKGRRALPYEYRFIKKNGEILWNLERLASIEYGGKRAAVGSFMDITDSKRMGEALSKSEERYRTVLEQMGESYYETDLAGNFTLFNDALCRQMGYSREELMGMNYKVYTPPEDVEKVFQLYSEVYSKGEPTHVEMEEIRKDGSRLFVENSVLPLRNEKGEIIGFRGIGRDISEHKQADEALAEEAARRRVLMERSRDGISILDEDSKLIEANERFAEMLGYTREEMEGFHTWDWDPQFTREELLEMGHNVDAAGIRIETRHRRKDGTFLDVEISVNSAVVAGKKLLFCVSRDITERKKAEEALRRSEQNFRDSIENSPLGIRIVDNDEKTIYANRALLDMWGYSSVEELEAVPKKQRYTPETYAEHRERIAKRKRGEPIPLEYETSIVRSDGQVRILSVSRGELIWNGEKRFQIVSQEITEHKQLQEALAKSEERYRTVLEQMEEAYYETDIAGKFTFCNEAMCRQLGYSTQDLIGMSFKVITPPEDLKEVFGFYNQVYSTGEPFTSVPIERVRKDGTRLSVETSIFPIRNESGDIVGFRGVATDVTERKQAEQALAEEATRRRMLMENSIVGISVLDENCKLVDANKRFADMLGYSLEEALELYVWDWDDHYTPEEIREMVRTVDETGQHFETRHRRKDGTYFDVELSNSAIVVGGKKLVFCVSSDITERKEAEEALRRSEQNFRDSIENSPLGIRVIDKDGKALYANRMLLDLWGFNSLEEMEAVPEDERYTPESYAEHIERREKAKRGESVPLVYETSIVRPDGEVVILSASRKKVLWGGQECFQVVYQDITERKEAEEALVEEATRRRMLMENSIDGISVLDENCKLVEANKRFAEMMGYTPEEVRELHVWDWDTDHTREEVLEMARTVDETGQHFETRHRRKDGTYIDVELSNNGVVVGGKKLIFCVSRDITERKEAEEALRRSEQNFHDSMENSPLGTRVLDKDGKTLYANQALLDLWGYGSLEELEAVPAEQRYTPEAYAEHKSRFKRRKEGEYESLNYETSIVRSDGQVRHVTASRAELLWGGEQCFQVVYQDITERKEAEEALRRSEQNFRDSIENSPLGIRIISKKDWKHLYANRALLDMWGYSSVEEMEAVPREKRYTPESLAQHVETLEKRKRGEPAPLVYELSIVRKDGQVRHLSMSRGELLWNGENQFQIVYHDITERKQAEQNFRDSIENSPLGMHVIDEGGKHLYTNRALLDIWGYSSAEELEAVPREQRYTPESYAEHMERLAKRGRGEPAPTTYEISIVRKDGQIRHLSVSRGELMWEGKLRFQVVYQDITERKQLQEALAKSEERYRTVLEQMDEAYFETDLAGNYTFVNDAMCRQSGYSREDLMGMNYRVYTPEDEVPRVYKGFHRVYETGRAIKGVPMGRIRKDGTLLSTETSAFPLRDESGEIIGFRGITRDVSERAQMIEALTESEERYRNILAEIQEGYYEVDLAGNFTFVNDAICRQLGYSPEELIGENYTVCVPKEEVKGVYKAWNKVYRTGKPLQSHPFTGIRKNKKHVFLEASVSPLRSKEGKIIGFRSVSRDVTERAQYEQKLTEMATHDALTGLPNRTLLSDRFTVALAMSRRSRNRLAVLMLDLDRFKAVNDSMGHDAGDKLLKEVGKRLEETVRKSDTVARIGGDEFVLVLPQIPHADEAANFAQRILDAFRKPFVFDDHSINITTSIGIAVYPGAGKDIESLLKSADTAMYWAKEQGRDIYRFYDGIEAGTLLAKRRTTA